MNKTTRRRWRLGLQAKFLLFLVAALLPIGAAVVFYVHALLQASRLELTREAAQRHVELHKEKTLAGMQGDLALARKMADSDVLRAWVREPDNLQRAQAALRELDSLVTLFSGQSAFVGSKPAGSFYYADSKTLAAAAGGILRPAQRLSEDDPDDAWFFATLKQKQGWNFNVDHNAALGVTKLWINVVMRDGDEAIGVVGAGIDLGQFIDRFVKSGQRGVSGMFLTDDGAIQGHADASLIAFNAPVEQSEQRSTIWRLLPDANERQALQAALRAVRSGEQTSVSLPLTMSGRPYIAAVAYLPPLQWTTLALFDLDTLASPVDLRPILFALLAGLTLLSLLVAGLGRRLLIDPLGQLAQGAQQVADGDYTVRLDEARADELGEVAAAFNRMAAALNEDRLRARSDVVALSVALQSARSLEDCGTALLGRLADRLGSRQGMLAVLDTIDEGRVDELRVVARYGAPVGEAPTRYAFNDGVVGQCARDRQAICLRLPQDQQWRIHCGLGSTAPAEVRLWPIVYGGELAGVLELAMPQPLDAAGEAMLDEAMPIIALRLRDLRRHGRQEEMRKATG